MTLVSALGLLGISATYLAVGDPPLAWPLWFSGLAGLCTALYALSDLFVGSRAVTPMRVAAQLGALAVGVGIVWQAAHGSGLALFGLVVAVLVSVLKYVKYAPGR